MVWSSRYKEMDAVGTDSALVMSRLPNTRANTQSCPGYAILSRQVETEG